MATCSKETFGSPAHGSTGSSSFPTCDIVHSQTCSYYHSIQDPVTFSEAAISNEPEKLWISDGRLETKVTHLHVTRVLCFINNIF